MTSLHELQRDFAQALATGDAGHVTAHLAGAPPSRSTRFSIYANNFTHGYVDALRAVYPVVLQLIGRDCFGQVARRYVRRRPAWSGDLHDYGGGFADHVSRQVELTGLPYLEGVARLEWARHLAYLAPDATPLRPEALADIPAAQWHALRFELCPSLRLIESAFPVDTIWHAHQPGADRSAAIHLDGSAHVLVQRRGLDLIVETIDAADYAFIAALAAGARLLDAFELAAAQATGAYALDAALVRLFQRGLPVEARAGPID